ARADYYPFRPYCLRCGRDDTTVTAFDDDSAQISYTCTCGATVGPVPIDQVRGKLVWKVDWPMRWAYERVTFEPAGVDHASPGSSFTVGRHLVEDIFGGEMPLHFGYSFVGTQGSAKMSGSAGVPRHRGTRWRSSRRRWFGGCTRGAARNSPSRWRSAPRWAGSTTSGTRSPARSARAPPSRALGSATRGLRLLPTVNCPRLPGRCPSVPWLPFLTSRRVTRSRSCASCGT